MGATAAECSIGALGTTVELRTGICASSQRDRPTNPDPTARFAAIPAQESAALSYSDEEIENLLRAALKISCRFERRALRPWVYYCLFGLLSVSGLRLGEARNLELQDVDLENGVLTIRGAKFGKTRLVPLHTSTCQVLRNYITRCNRHWVGRRVASFFVRFQLGQSVGWRRHSSNLL